MIVVFGGTFDPVHRGHENMARHAVSALSADALYFMPCALPVHKAAPGVTTQHRVEMLKLVCQSNASFHIDTRELERTTPSYSLLSIQQWRDANPEEPIAFLLGMDSFNNLTSWYQWKTLVRLCHIVVYQRPGESFLPNQELQDYVYRCQAESPEQLTKQTSGHCYFLAGPTVDIASSSLRSRLGRDEATDLFLSQEVLAYINQHGLYTENPKST